MLHKIVKRKQNDKLSDIQFSVNFLSFYLYKNLTKLSQISEFCSFLNLYALFIFIN